mmetsp:Transcript_9712/g.11066  ORF Transcript_9712/g.11066 Transcript_9712/m.11066 type:complete len:80 (+) Transcript_9712:210-449(+)
MSKMKQPGDHSVGSQVTEENTKSSVRITVGNGKNKNRVKIIEDPYKYVIHPDSRLSKVWHFILLILIFFTVFFTPYQFG